MPGGVGKDRGGKEQGVGILIGSLFSLRGEADIRASVDELLREAGLGGPSERWLEYSPGKGRADIVFPSAKLVIETKARGSLCSDRQKRQLGGYLGQLAEQDQDPFALPWRGVLTDGLTWDVYEWRGGEGGLRRVREVPFQLGGGSDGLRAFLEFFRICLAPEHRRVKPPPPDDLGVSVLRPFLQGLEKPAEKAEEDEHFRTKFSTWSSVLRGAGMLPPEQQVLRTRRLFREHTALVTAARGIVAAVGAQAGQGGAGLEQTVAQSLGSGFVAWLPAVPEGRQRSTQLFRDLAGYEWRGSTKDVLRTAYEQLIDRVDRKEFGEYYTPDWLAAAVCEDILDPPWLDRALEAARKVLKDPGIGEVSVEKNPLAGIGVLDPACGSGTFLFHAARRIVDYAIRHRCSPRVACRAAAALVHGMDIHPVAVEMSRAVLRTALPYLEEADTDRLSVYVGDALQADEFRGGPLRRQAPDEERRGGVQVDEFRAASLLGEKTVTIHSSKGNPIEIPRALLRRPDFARIIHDMVKAALAPAELKDGAEGGFHPESFPGMHKDLASQLRNTYAVLRDICRDEGNHVWAWRILNTAKPLQLSGAGINRMVGNPPWLVANDTPEGDRKNAIREMFQGYGLHSRLRGSSAKGDLAALFSARAVDLYLARSRSHSRFGFVLPGSALIGQVWAGFRSGHWKSTARGVEVRLEEAWDLSGVKEPPFPHAPNQACVIRGRIGEARALPGTQRWMAEGVRPDMDWREARKRIRRGAAAPVRTFPERRGGAYTGKFHRGAVFSPLCLGVTTEWEQQADGLVCFKTYRSTKGPWKGLQYEGRIESEATHLMLRSQGLQPFRAEPDALLLAPLQANGAMADLDGWPPGLLPHARQWFREKDRIFREHRSAKAAPSLLGNIDWKGTFTKQHRQGIASPQGLRKVVYNKSGNKLKACRIQAGLVVNDKCYHAILRTPAEAAYLVAVLNAPCLRKAWNYYKSSALDYDLNPLRSVPVPAYDRTNTLHRDLAKAAREAEQAAQQGEPGAADLNPAVQRIDQNVRTLLPKYAS